MEGNSQGLKNFVISSIETSQIGDEWEKWKRSFEIYLMVKEITDPIKKKVHLLHQGGVELQEVFRNLPDDEGDTVSATNDIYKICLNKLDRYFIPQRCATYERYVFRKIKQEQEESIESFVMRLRQQANKCNFGQAYEICMVDQIVEKCRSDDMRKRFLEKDLSLNEILKVAKSEEMATLQAKSFKDKSSQRDIETVSRVERVPDKRECFRCGDSGHIASDPKCKAINATCRKCNLKGHFAVKCRSKKRKQSDSNFQNSDSKKMKINAIEVGSKDEDYLFYLSDDGDDIDNYKTDNRFFVKIGGVMIKIIIDSGSDVNVMGELYWDQLKRNNVAVIHQERCFKKNLKPYGDSSPLDVVGSFTASVQVGENETKAKFYVIKGNHKPLLSKETSVILKILRLGLEVNRIETSDINQFPKIKGFQIEIPINKDITPVCQPYRRVPMPLEQKIENKLKELLELDIIEPVIGPSLWVSPMVPIIKSNGELRICIDMRAANRAVQRINYPLPTLDDFLPELKNCALFSRLDIKNAFHQLEIAEKSRFITTFITKRGLFRYKRLNFGISCAPEIFQKVLEQVLISCEGCLSYIDDIIIYGSNREVHDARLHKVLDTLNSYDVYLNESKCIYRATELIFLGTLLSKDGVKPDPDKVKAIKNFRAPETTEELRSFLGVVGFVSRFIPHLSTHTHLLRELLQHNAKFDWNQNHQKCFDKIKEIISNPTSLGYYNVHDKTRLVVDASPVGLGAVLLQFDKNDEPRPIYYASRSLTDIEKRYCTTEKEALACVWAVEKFKNYLIGKRFELETDHKALTSVFKHNSKPCARVERWVLRLQGFDYECVYRSGKSNIADPFSRLLQIENLSEENSEIELELNALVEVQRPIAVTMSEIIEATNNDSTIQLIKSGLESDNWDESILFYKIFATEFCFVNGVLLRGTKIVVPEKLQKKMLELGHEGHPGSTVMKRRLRSKIWWYKMDKMIEDFVNRCKGCILVSAPNAPEPVTRRELPTRPWMNLAIDFKGPLPSGENLRENYFSRYQEIVIMDHITASETILNLKMIFARHGKPRTIDADNGRQFKCEEFANFCKEYDIRLNYTIPYWPQMNGEVERQNRAIEKRLVIAHNMGKDWKQELADYLLMYHSTPHSVTGRSPFELMNNRKMCDKLPSLVETSDKYEEIRDSDKFSKEKGKRYIDKKRKAKENSNLKPGDSVLVQNMIKHNKMSPRFLPDQFKVKAINGSDVLIENIDGKIFRRNIAQLKKVEFDSTIDQTVNEESEHEQNDYELVEVEENNENNEASSIDKNQDKSSSSVQTESIPNIAGKRIRKPPKKLEDYVA